jgi:hypothetical protein
MLVSTTTNFPEYVEDYRVCDLMLDDDIFNIISLIEYYIYFNLNYIIFDNIINIEYNNIFDNINIIYYNDINELSDLFMNCKDYNIYINSTEKAWNENKNII